MPPAVCPSLLESATTVCTSFLHLFPRTYIRRRLIPYYDSGPLHKHQIYVRPIFHFVPLVESGICLLVDVATLSTIYDVRHPLLLPPGYPTQELISHPQAVRPPSSTPPGCPKREKKKKLRYKFSAFFVTPTLPAPCGVV